MKSGSVFATLTLVCCFVLFPVMVDAQTVDPQWSGHDMTVKENSFASSVWFLGDTRNKIVCTVLVYRDRSITVAATDRHYVDPTDKEIWTLRQSTTIRRVDGTIKVTVSYTETRGTIVRETPNGYDIFGERYKSTAKSLPRKIQNLFYGEYGIGGKP